MAPSIIELDVRPYLRKKLEPFQLIMDTVKKLDKEDTFVLHATFKPTPLLGLMKTKGYKAKCEKLEKDHWVVTFVHKNRQADPKPGADQEGLEPTMRQQDDGQDPSASESEGESAVYELDNRGLEPPQPMMRTLSKLESAKPGDTVRIHNDRVPLFLIEELNALGYAYEVDQQADGSAIVSIRKS